ncbi:MAG: ComF family protein [Nitrospirae bacterium]|nr:ComF family protein [Nitrospirota bacterium]
MKMLSNLLNTIYPATCKNCKNIVSADAATAYFCKACWQDIGWFNGPCCPKCGLPYTSPYPDTDNKLYCGQSTANYPCGNCREKPPPFDMAVSAGRYSGALAEAVKLFKYKKKIHLGKRLTEEALKSSSIDGILRSFQAAYPPHTVWGCPAIRLDSLSAQTMIVPVPLHLKRLREREFNQSAIIGSVIGKRYGIPVAANTLMRHRNTRPQVELDAKERKENVTGAFCVEDRTLIEGRKIILVDDVYTSGSTLNECTRVLKRNGADKVYVITIARMTG